jgi:hypothetical protein
MKKVIYCLSLLFLMGACNKEKNEPKEDTIVGEWAWIKTGGYGKRLSPYYNTPENTNSTMTYIFTATDFTIIKDNTRQGTLPYTVTNEIYKRTNKLSDFINFNEDDLTELRLSSKFAISLSPQKDTLVIDDYLMEGCGLPTYYFVRVQQ